ncbi:VOC family protein [Mesorhizobium erdmanii]|uniref:VOC family protein n=1 Tax=Mesorhizobium erdmanii TaxID=1777866 RepID=A0A6M7UGS4_9HYPH|nr:MULTISPECIES: VOC family protein [Mesorhizobium]OBQ73382.1 glyoxalase [Mesorhizobium loti]QKC76421.1 VOC family protein [Mesorhizobium erdmanii]
MQLRHILIKVDDQDKALAFYTSVLGFVKKRDYDGGQARWLTVVSPDQADGAELVLEPNRDAPARAAQKALHDAHFPAALITCRDIQADYDRLAGRGVKFLGPPRRMGPVSAAFFDDTCGNVIVMAEQPG